MAEADLVRFEKDGDIGIIIVDNPPVNALSPGVPQGIVDALDKGNADSGVKAMVLIGAGRSFIAGADIRQFGKSSAPPPTRRHYDVMDQSPKPVVAAIHGYALGGGLETALACHYRVAVPSAKVGLPEVLIGILPGAGGTQRLPRLIGPKLALEMITSGRHVPAEEAHKLGIVDEIAPEGKLKEAAIAFARKIADKKPLPVIRNSDGKLAEGTQELFDNMRKSIARRARNQRAPYACIEAVEAACKLPFDEGAALERKLFDEQVGSEEAKSLRYAFFAEREVNKIPFIPADTKLRPTDHPAVVGAGTMGGGIAMSFADNGYDVKLTDATPEALERGMARIKANYETSVKRGSLAQDEYERRFARIHPVPSFDDLSDCDVVIEAVFEQIPVKEEVWKKLDAVMPPGALLYTNTSGIDIDIIADATKRPQDMAGTHFFAPANVMKLFEVVKGTKTENDVLATAMALGRKIGKASGLAGNGDGFLANRSRAPFGMEVNLLIE
jgi:3-hydroxyacyl-CoA dehydrogenase